MGQKNSNENICSWMAIGCETRGRSHVEEDLVCQDKTYVLKKDGVHAFALADGAGSAALSHYGAEIVTREACRLLCQCFREFFYELSGAEVKKRIKDHLICELRKTAAYHGCSLRDLASTILAVAVCGNCYLYFHIGDGVIGYAKNGMVKVASAPENGEFCNTTYFVTSSDAVRVMHIGKGEDAAIYGFILMSDGTEAGLYNKREKKIAPVLEKLICRLSITSSEYLFPHLQSSLDNVVSKKTHDDCSLVLAAKVERTYADLSEEEQKEYFEIPQSIQPRTAKMRIKRYVGILNALENERSDVDLAKEVGLKDIKKFVKAWLSPLIKLGYICKPRPHMYRRVIGPVTVSGPEDMSGEEEKT